MPGDVHTATDPPPVRASRAQGHLGCDLGLARLDSREVGTTPLLRHRDLTVSLTPPDLPLTLGEEDDLRVPLGHSAWLK